MSSMGVLGMAELAWGGSSMMEDRRWKIEDRRPKLAGFIEPSVRLRQTRFEFHVGFPAEDLAGLVDLHGRTLLLAVALGGELDRHAHLRGALERLGQVQPARLDGGADVEGAVVQAPHAGKLGGRGEDVRSGDVRHEHVIARLLAIAVDRERAAVEESLAEDRDDAGLPAWVLSRTVDVRVAQRDGIEAVGASVVGEVVLDAEFRYAVRRLGILGRFLRARRSARVTVDGAARRREDHARAMRCVAGGLEEIDRSDDVARRVRARIRDADANVHLRREHEHRVEAPLADEDRRLRTADVEMLESRACGNVRALAVR